MTTMKQSSILRTVDTTPTTTLTVNKIATPNSVKARDNTIDQTEAISDGRNRALRTITVDRNQKLALSAKRKDAGLIQSQVQGDIQ